jgi:hypothetical protein
MQTTLQLESEVNCHNLINPPAEDRGCNVNLIINNAGSLILLTKKEVSLAETTCSLRIDDVLAMGFTSGEQYIITKEFANLLLAFNLSLKRVCMTNRRSEFSPIKTQILFELTKKLGSMVRKTARKVEVIINEDPVLILDSVRITVGISEEIDIPPIIQLFRNIQQVRKPESYESSSLHDINLRSSLRNYENGMSEFNVLFKFKSIYNALELVTNVNGENREKEKFDNEVCRLSGVSTDIVRAWRGFYNRTKHVQRNSSDMSTYSSGNKELTNYLSEIRKCTQSILLSKLVR